MAMHSDTGKTWKQYLFKENLSEDELRKIPGFSNNNTVAVYKYYSEHFGLTLEELFTDIDIPVVEKLDEKRWLSARDANKLNYNTFYYAKKFVTHQEHYRAAAQLEIFSKNLTYFYFFLIPFQFFFKGLVRENEKWNYQWILKSIQNGQNWAILKQTPFPYFEGIRIGSECKWVRGVLESALMLHGISKCESHEAFCSMKFSEIIDGVYAKHKWGLEYREEAVYLNGSFLAEKTGIIWEIKDKHILLTRTPPGMGFFDAYHIPHDWYFNEYLVFEKGEIYEAPFCLFEFYWKKLHLPGKVVNAVRRISEYRRTMLSVIDKQLEFSNERVFQQINADNKGSIENFCNDFTISKRECEVLVLLVQGLSNTEISDKLYISLSAVKSHVSQLLKKTNTSSRSQLAVKVLLKS